MFIRKKKLLNLIKEKQLEIRERNRTIKEEYAKENNSNALRFWNGYDQGNDNAFNWIIGKLERKKIKKRKKHKYFS